MKRRINLILGVILTGSIVFFSCKKDPSIVVETDYSYDDTPSNISYGTTLGNPSFPTDNELTVAKVQLGRELFYDKKLSGDESMACAGCHVQKDGFSDKRRFSEGIDGLKGGRQAMPIFNMAWHTNQFFWDGRANLLRDQSLLPIQDPLEMHEDLDNVLAKLERYPNYNSKFNRAFGTKEITTERISLALEAFMNSIISKDSKYDQFLRGEVQLTASEERGRALYFQEYNEFFPETSGADCAHCHGGGNFENDKYMNNGLDSDAQMMDDGRMKATDVAMDKGKFKVPSLRNVAVTAPYMHDGRFETLEEVVEHYNNGIKESTTLDPALNATRGTGLMLDDQEKTDLVNFLKTLTDETFLNNPDYSDPFVE